jgi:large subunit ribosomal protein L29
MKQAEIIGLTNDELKERIAIHQQNLQKLELGHTISQLENPLSLRHARRDVARLKTEWRKRQINAEK